MRIEEKAIGWLKPYERNPRFNDASVDMVAESIKAYGFKNPIITDKDGVIIAGHTRLKAAQKLGLKKVPVIVAEDLSPEKARAFRLADNKTSEMSFWDNKLLLEELTDIDWSEFTGFELGGLFDDTLAEDDESILAENTEGVAFEITFRSEERWKIEKIQALWLELDYADEPR